jgi:hypothetical protein
MRDTIPDELPSQAEPTVAFLSTDCYDHAGHLADKAGLKLIDVKLVVLNKPWGYYSTAVKLGYQWRGDHASIYADIADPIDGDPDKATAAKSLCPQVDASRWGGVHMFEEKATSVGVPLLCGKIRRRIIAKQAKRSNGRKCTAKSAAAQGPDELATEPMHEYTRNMNRLTKSVYHASAK